MTQAVDLYWTEQGAGPPMLILHGLYGSGRNWSRHVRWLAEQWRVITPDLRNHGRSPHAEPMDYPAMAEDVLRLMDTADCAQAVLLGHSMGGKVAMNLALRWPERVRALVAVDIAPVDYGNGDGEHARILAAMAAIDPGQVKQRSEVDAALQQAVDSAMVRQFLLTNLERAGQGWRWRIPVQRLQAALPALAAFPAVQGHYDGPALFLRGALSAYQDDRHAAEVRRLFPQAELAEIADAGHWLHVEQPAAFAESLRQWLARLD